MPRYCILTALFCCVATTHATWAQDAIMEWGIGNADWVSPAVERDRLITDRPHVSEATATVGRGRLQLETGYSYFFDDDRGTQTQLHSFAEPLLRWGMFADWFELRLGTNYLIETQSTGGVRTRRSGRDDMLLASKVAIVKQRGVLPDFTIFPQMRLPTGGDAWSADRVQPGVNCAYSWMLTKRIELECNTVFNRRVSDSGTLYTESLQTVNLEYDLGDQWLGFTEFLFVMPWNHSVDAPAENYFHTGLQYYITQNTQLDVHSAVGLNRTAKNLAFSGVGFCVRW